MCYDFALCAVQQACIPIALQGQDVIGQAKSGMGKTAVFVLGVLHQLEPENGKVAALVLSHTRELAQQVRVLVLYLSMVAREGYLTLGPHPLSVLMRDACRLKQSSSGLQSTWIRQCG